MPEILGIDPSQSQSLAHKKLHFGILSHMLSLFLSHTEYRTFMELARQLHNLAQGLVHFEIGALDVEMLLSTLLSVVQEVCFVSVRARTHAHCECRKFLISTEVRAQAHARIPTNVERSGWGTFGRMPWITRGSVPSLPSRW